MMKQTIADKFLVQNLMDAGCVPDFINLFIQCYEQDNDFANQKGEQPDLRKCWITVSVMSISQARSASA